MSSLTDPNNVIIEIKYDRANENPFSIVSAAPLDLSKEPEVVWVCDDIAVTATFNPENCPFSSNTFQFGEGVSALTGTPSPTIGVGDYPFALTLTDPPPFGSNRSFVGTLTIIGGGGAIRGGQSDTRKPAKPPAIAAAARNAAQAAVKAAESARKAADAADKAAQAANNAAAWATALAAPTAPAKKAAAKKKKK
jgi:hypothetical protein